MKDSVYEKFMIERGIQEFTIDGAINREIWNKSPNKILFYLKENYGYEGEGIIRIEDYAQRWFDDGIPTYKKITLLAAAIHEAIQLQRCLTQIEIDELAADSARLHKELNQLALVNIKKHSGLSKSNDGEIREESYHNANLLKDQIAALSPSIIVAGGTVCWHSLVCDLGLCKEAHDNPKISAVFCNEIILCHSNHPAARGDGFNIEEIHRAIFNVICNH